MALSVLDTVSNLIFQIQSATALDDAENLIDDMRSIVNLVEHPEEQRREEATRIVIQLNGIERVLSCFDYWFDTGDELDLLYSRAMLLIGNLLSFSIEARWQFFNAGGLQRVLNAARTRAAARRDELRCFGYGLIQILTNCAVVEEIPLRNFTRMWEAVVTDQCVALVLETMHTWPQSLDIQHAACLYFLRISEVVDDPTRERVLTNEIFGPLETARNTLFQAAQDMPRTRGQLEFVAADIDGLLQTLQADE